MGKKSKKMRQMINELGGYVDLQAIGGHRTSSRKENFNFNPEEFNRLHERKGKVMLSENSSSSIMLERHQDRYNLVIRQGSQEKVLELDGAAINELRMLLNR